MLLFYYYYYYYYATTTTILYYTILYYTILYYTILYYTILYYTTTTTTTITIEALARLRTISMVGCFEKADILAALRKAGIDDAAAEKFENGSTSTNNSNT